MATEAEILAEVEELGRLSEEQEQILYNISLRQDELGRQPSHTLYEKIQGETIYKDMLDREYLTYELYDHGGEDGPKVVNLIVTLKGLRYCIIFGDEISAKRKWDAAGNLRQK